MGPHGCPPSSSRLRLLVSSWMDLLDRVKRSTPDFFERIVLQLLLAMGYGGSYPSHMLATRSRWRGWLAASAMSAASVMIAPPPTLACSGPPLTFAAVVSGSELIIEGTVDEVMFDGLAFRLAVKEVSTGPAVGSDVWIGPTAGPEGRGCEVGLQVGEHVVLGIVDMHAQLNALATAVWFVGPDGSLSSPGSLWEVATDIEDLRAKLRQAVPDTALPFEPPGAPASTCPLYTS